MGRRVQAEIPSPPEKIGTQFGEYKVNMSGRFYTIQCKVKFVNLLEGLKGVVVEILVVRWDQKFKISNGIILNKTF